jgi:hypothetical protein
MARTLIIPDIHHKISVVDEVLERESFDRVVFLGDYFDDFNDGPEEARRTAEWLRAHVEDARFTFLYGNHDVPYRFSAPGLECPGYHLDKWMVVVQVLTESCWSRFQLHAWVDGILLTHAGWNRRFAGAGGEVSAEFIDRLCAECLRDLSEGRMHPLAAAGTSRGGREPSGGVTWQDWRELEPIPGLRQIVGHTPDLRVRQKQVGRGSAVCLDTRLLHYGCLENGVFTSRLTSIGEKWLGPGGRFHGL